MKKVLFAVSVLALCSCGKSNEDKAKELIEANLKTSMKDWSSYESVTFSKLDSVFTEYQNTPEGTKLQMKVSELQQQSDSIKYLANETGKKELFDLALSKIREAIQLDSTYNINKEKFKGEFKGWQMVHRYRGNNSYGAKEIASTAFYFDKDVTKVTDKLSLD